MAKGVLKYYIILMQNMEKEQILTAISVMLLLFTAMINWNVYSWLILVAMILILMAWYYKK